MREDEERAITSAGKTQYPPQEKSGPEMPSPEEAYTIVLTVGRETGVGRDGKSQSPVVGLLSSSLEGYRNYPTRRGPGDPE
jgi:hypothetical protein